MAAVGLLAAPARRRRMSECRRASRVHAMLEEAKMTKANVHGRREFLKGGAAAIVAAACSRPAVRAANLQDDPSVHGMLIVGQETVFLSHLPIFGSPHDYQVILEATFTKQGGNPQGDYFADRKRTGTKVYTLEPDRFVLPGLAAASPLRSFTANIYRGHFERFPSQRAKDAARIAQSVNVTVARVVHFRKFDPAAARPPQLEYLVFGKGAELFLAHLVTSPPDFDHVLSATSLGHKFTDVELSQGTHLRFPGKKDSAANRIRGVQAVSGQITLNGAVSTVQLQPGTEFYLEQRELAS
jgi:hypothetical protein